MAGADVAKGLTWQRGSRTAASLQIFMFMCASLGGNAASACGAARPGAGWGCIAAGHTHLQ